MTTTADGPLEATADAHVRTTCPRCDARPAAARRALTDAVDAALAERLPVAAGRRGAARCDGCATPLAMPLRATSRALTVTPGASPPFTVTVRLPLVRCGGCGRDLVPPELGRPLRDVVHRAAGSVPGAGGPLRSLRRRRGRRSPGPPASP